MSKPRRRKQKKQVKPELKLRQFAATELSDQLAAQHSAADLPRFLVDTVAGAYAPADAELMIEGFGAAATRPVTLRANTLKATAEDIAAALDAAGIAHQTVAWYPDAFILPEAQVSDLWDLDIYRNGKIYLQSLSSMMPPLVLGAQAGEDILDMCAAPGGKTTQIAALTQGQAHLTACEMSIPRAEKLEANLGRQGAKNVPVMRIDARELDEFETHRALAVCDDYLRAANKRWSDASKAANKLEGSEANAAMTQALVDAFTELRVATVLMHGIVPAGCELICEYFDIDPVAFFSWDNIFASTDEFVESLGEKPGEHRVKPLPPRFDFFSKHESQY